MARPPKPSPVHEEAYQQLTALAAQLGIEVRLDNTDGGGGGLYVLKGKKHLLLNKNAPVGERVETLIETLKNEDLSDVFVVPAVRQWLGLE
ncbi:MAG: hypothetical protein V1913_18610 [Fibrobacterota bacterium]